MTYTTVHKDYAADTFEEAAAMALRDTAVFDFVPLVADELGGADKEAQGEWRGYAINSWAWKDGVLTVNFR